MISDRMEKTNQPLVSVAVITYNSSKTVVETLDSIYNQTYPNLELIVSDDCSMDNTVGICRDWIDLHKNRFVRTEIVTIDKNTGVSANMNRAEAACKGEWVKPIAGDDLLMPECVEIYISYVQEHPEAICAFAKMLSFNDKDGARQIEDIPLNYSFFTWSIEEQYFHLINVKNEVPAPTSFYNKAKVKDLGVKNDERIPMMEDWPRWINLLKKEVRFHFVDKELVMYRISENSLSNTSDKSKAYIVSLALFYVHYQFKELYRHGNKKEAVRRYVKAKRYIEDNVFWKGMHFITKRLL